MARGRSFGGARGVKPPQRQISNMSNQGEVDGLTTVIGIVKALGTFGLSTAVGAATIVRTRGSLLVRVAAAAAGDTTLRGAMGIIQVSADAFAAGVASVPGPLSDSLDDWYVWVPFTLAFDDITTEFDSAYFDRVAFDSRGMRKTKFGEVSAVVFEVDCDRAGSSIDISYVYREQIKL